MLAKALLGQSILEGASMTEAIGSSTAAEAARALAATQQASQRSAAAAAQSAATGRSGNDGDSITLSKQAQAILRLQDGTELLPIPLDKLKLITPEGQRSEAEAAIRQMMVDLGIEGDLQFSIKMRADGSRGGGSIVVENSNPRAAEIEAAINGDPALQKTLRNMHMSSKIAYEMPAMREMFEASRAAGDKPVSPDLFSTARSARERTEAASYAFTLTGGILTTAFVDPSGAHFGGVAPEAGPA
jgi:hypothetical protein